MHTSCIVWAAQCSEFAICVAHFIGQGVELESLDQVCMVQESASQLHPVQFY